MKKTTGIPKKSRAKKLRARGRPTIVGRGDRLSRDQIAFRAKISRTTVRKYLGMDGAPQPDGGNLFSMKEVLAFIEKNSTRGPDSDEMRGLREAKLRVEAEEAAFDFGVKRGKYIELGKIAPTLSAFFKQHLVDAQAIFEHELPVKYSGKSQVECQQLNAEGIDRLFTRAKAWRDTLTEAPLAA